MSKRKVVYKQPSSKQTSQEKIAPEPALKRTGMSKQSFHHWLLFTSIKLGIALIFALFIYMIYLDGKVTKVFEGQRWKIPVRVYGQVKTLSLNHMVNITKIVNALKLTNYRQVAVVKQVGQFSYTDQRLVIYRRAFNFGLGKDPAINIIVDLKNNKISQLIVDNSAVEKIRLEPVLLDRIVPNNNEDRVLVSLENVPEKLLDTLLLVEDRNFYFHFGIAPLGILRAMLANIRAGHTVQGGSTLTQQLVKNMFLTRTRSISRKINEALMAIILEHKYSKDQLLEAYINEVYLGQNYADGVYGFGLASQFYFGKSLAQLSTAQMVLLVAEIRGPSYYDPWRYPQRAQQRRDLILKLMFEHHSIELEAYKVAVNSPLLIRRNRRMAQKAHPAYIALVTKELNKILTNFPHQEKTSGLLVFTGFSAQNQQLLEQTVTEQLPKIELQHHTSKLETAMIVTDIQSGEISAVIGGSKVSYAGFNRAISAQRPIGSLVKPAIYLAALERYQQYNLATPLADKPITLKDSYGKIWQPKDYDGKYRGKVSLLRALVESLNVPTVNLGLKLGLTKVADALYLLGYPQPITLRPSMLLGALNMSPLAVNQLYLPIAKNGFYQQQHTIKAIYNNQDAAIWQFDNVNDKRISDTGSYLLNYALRQVTKQGTARSLTWRLPEHDLAGKTGTTNDLRDSWFVGFDNKHLVTTWIGRDDNKSTHLTGSSGALVLFADFIKKIGVVDRQLVMPNGIALTSFELKTGDAVAAHCTNVVEYPAVTVGIVLNANCANQRLNKTTKRSWLQRLFGH